MTRTYIAKDVGIINEFWKKVPRADFLINHTWDEAIDQLWLSCGGTIKEVDEDALIAEANAKFEAAFREEQNVDEQSDERERQWLHDMGQGA